MSSSEALGSSLVLLAALLAVSAALPGIPTPLRIGVVVVQVTLIATGMVLLGGREGRRRWRSGSHRQSDIER